MDPLYEAGLKLQTKVKDNGVFSRISQRYKKSQNCRDVKELKITFSDLRIVWKIIVATLIVS